MLITRLVKPLCMVYILKHRAKPPNCVDLHLIKYQWQSGTEFKAECAFLLKFRPHKLYWMGFLWGEKCRGWETDESFGLQGERRVITWLLRVCRSLGFTEVTALTVRHFFWFAAPTTSQFYVIPVGFVQHTFPQPFLNVKIRNPPPPLRCVIVTWGQSSGATQGDCGAEGDCRALTRKVQILTISSLVELARVSLGADPWGSVLSLSPGPAAARGRGEAVTGDVWGLLQWLDLTSGFFFTSGSLQSEQVVASGKVGPLVWPTLAQKLAHT